MTPKCDKIIFIEHNFYNLKYSLFRHKYIAWADASGEIMNNE